MSYHVAVVRMLCLFDHLDIMADKKQKNLDTENYHHVYIKRDMPVEKA